MTLVEQRTASRRVGTVLGSSLYPQNMGSYGMGRDVRAGALLDPSPAAGMGALGDTQVLSSHIPETVGERDLSICVSLLTAGWMHISCT